MICKFTRTIDTLNVDKIEVKKQNDANKCLETLYAQQDELHKLMKINELNKEELVQVFFCKTNDVSVIVKNIFLARSQDIRFLD